MTDGPPLPTRRRRAATLGVRVGVIALLVALVLWANIYAVEHDLVRDSARRFGYGGILAAAALSGFNLVIPVPIVAFFPFFVRVGFEPVLTVAVIALGMTLGDLLGYLVGNTARAVLDPRSRGVMARLERIRDRHPYLPFAVMFVYAAFVPLPNEILVIPLAFLRYPVASIFTAVLIGNAIFNSLVAFGVLRIFG